MVRGAWLCTCAAVVVYLNTLRCEFAFDDSFAVTNNRDVTDRSAPLADLLTHDFWGQDIRSETSHKSFRPGCVLFFRLLRWLSPSAQGTPSAAWFHGANVVLHALATALVHRVALCLGKASGARCPCTSALLAGLLFAVHPCHTEAVAGVVGAAELLCCCFSLLCFLAYMRAVRLNTGAGSALHTLLALLCAAMGVACKETGLAVCAACGLWEALAALSVPQTGTKPPAGRPARRPALLRLAATACFVAAYLGVRRSVIGGDTLVKIYRKVENPVAFLPTRTQRLLTTAHSHARYGLLLVAPVELSCDWSHACLAPVESLRDARLLGAALLYALLAFPCLRAAVLPWRRECTAAALRGARVRAFTLLAFGAAPFAPAANLLFYVGTFVGERLLYLPSIAFCVILGDVLASACGPLCSVNAAPPGHAPRAPRCARAATALLLCLYAARTALRNEDWRSEGSLFTAAMDVCPNSAKVRLNNGILARRTQDWPAALRHFRRAAALEPEQYCEPQYWEALTLINVGHFAQGEQMLVDALDCKWVAVPAATALHTVLSTRLAETPNDVDALRRGGELLLRTNSTVQACSFFARAAAELSRLGRAQEARAARERCAREAPAAAADAQALEKCALQVMELRPKVASAGKDPAARVRAQQLGLSQVGPACGGSEDYFRLVHEWQTGDPYHAQMHEEWARLLELRDRAPEAEPHRRAAHMLRLQQQQQQHREVNTEL